MLPRLIIAIFVLLFANNAVAKRVALVVGNDRYADVEPLKKAVNDAKAMGATLRGLGFDVVEALNVGRRDFNRSILKFTSRLEKGDEALVFYAGHGLEISGQNYLLPVDVPEAKSGQEQFIRGEAILADSIIERMRDQGVRVSILIIDACRNNPFPRSGTRSLGGTRGLARMAAPEGSFVMFSAGIGQLALDEVGDDDRHENSVFTRMLIKQIQLPGIAIDEIAKNVRRSVVSLAKTINHDQRPAYYDEMLGKFYFVKPSGRVVKQTNTSAVKEAFAVAKATNNAAVLRAFARRHRGTVWADMALALAETAGKQKMASLAPAKLPSIENKNRQKTGAKGRTSDANLPLFKAPFWKVFHDAYPAWTKAQLNNAYKLQANGKTRDTILATVVKSIVEWRRKNADKILAASPDHLRTLAKTFVANLKFLVTQDVQACYGYISKGELSPTVLPLFGNPTYVGQLGIHTEAIIAAAQNGKTATKSYPEPINQDFSDMANLLLKRGWTETDLKMFSDPTQLSNAPASKVCTLVTQWFETQLQMPPSDKQMRLLATSLQPVVRG